MESHLASTTVEKRRHASIQIVFNESVSVNIQLEGSLIVLEHNPSNSYAATALQGMRALIDLVILWVPQFGDLRLEEMIKYRVSTCLSSLYGAGDLPKSCGRNNWTIRCHC
jgi:hypothetical protein